MKKAFHLYFLFFTFLLQSSIQLIAQNAPQPKWARTPSGILRCFTDEMNEYRLQQSGVNVSERKAAFESWMNTQVQNLEQQSNLQNRSVPIIYTMPVIFHIIHNGEAVGTGTNIATLQVSAQIQQLNNDFAKLFGTSGYNTHPSGADVQIQFCAATLNPANGTLGEPGIERINRNTKGWTAPPFLDTYIEATIKPNSIWDPTKYLNIWVCNVTTAAGAVLGYAQFPDAPNELGIGVNNSANTDGVVVYYSSVGSSVQKFPGSNPYDEGRTATHEIGHWLGLRHIWGDGGCEVDDYIFDTPRSSGANFGCGVNVNSCNDSTYGFTSDPKDMVQNYLDYSDDGCMNIFTIGQKNRMRVVMGETLNGSPRRGILRLSDRCQATPLVSFVTTDTTVFEKTNCNLNWSYAIPVYISRAPNADTYVQMQLAGGTANGGDLTIFPDTVFFSATDITDKYFYVQVKSDAVFEGHEQAIFSLNVTNSNATAAADNYEMIIMNDDYMPFMGKRMPMTLLNEDFENTPTGWNIHEYVGGNNKWLVSGSNGGLNGSKSAYISNNANSLDYTSTSYSQTILFKEINAYNADSLALSFYYLCKGDKDANGIYDYGKVVYSLDSITFHQLNGTADLVDSSNMTYFYTPLPYFLWNQKFYIGFFWENDNIVKNDPPFAVDDIVITGKTRIMSMVHTAVDTAFGYAVKPLGPMETVDFYDEFTGDVLATIQNLSGFNYGCVRVEVDRAGNMAQWVTGDPGTNPKTKLFDKTYRITPQYNNATGSYTITFYLTQAETMGWMINSTNPLPMAQIIKYNGPISTMTYTSTFEQQPSTKVNYLTGIDKQFTATFNTGFSGFGFGIIPGSTLPVNLLSFAATENNKTVLVKWKVENEINTDHYIVLRSADGNNFTEIGNITAKGTSNGSAEYSLIDNQPDMGRNFYQLVSYDRDGRFKKSEIVEVNIRISAVYEVMSNPFTDKITIKTNSNSRHALQVVLTDAAGKQIFAKHIIGNTGGIISLPVPAISAGIYFLKIADAESNTVFKVIKQ